LVLFLGEYEIFINFIRHGDRLNQLFGPVAVFVDRDYSVYVSDARKGEGEGAKEGIVVAGGRDQGKALTLLQHPRGLFVDLLGTVYVADFSNDRVIRWCKRKTQGKVIVGGNGEGDKANKFNGPAGLSFDRHGNLHVVDWRNDRVQRFSIE
jgi:DNA-binding beta-propeller fold protein YncE